MIYVVFPKRHNSESISESRIGLSKKKNSSNSRKSTILETTHFFSKKKLTQVNISSSTSEKVSRIQRTQSRPGKRTALDIQKAKSGTQTCTHTHKSTQCLVYIIRREAFDSRLENTARVARFQMAFPRFSLPRGGGKTIFLLHRTKNANLEPDEMLALFILWTWKTVLAPFLFVVRNAL